MSKCTCDPLDLGAAGHLLGCPLNPQTPAEFVPGDGEWTYSTHDEVSHLAITDVRVLRSRIDMLLEERREAKKGVLLEGGSERSEWKLTGIEGRFVGALLQRRGVVTKEVLHAALYSGREPDTEQKIVDVIACKVRKKLKPHFPEGTVVFETVWGRGYSASDALRRAVS